MRKSHEPGLSAAILAGGASSRFGTNKALALLDGVPLVARAAATLAQVSADVFVVANDPAPYVALGLRVFADPSPGFGPLSGLDGALAHARLESVFVTACDMPFVHAALVRELAQALGGYEAVMPESESGVEPLHAVYARSAAPKLRAAMQAGALRLRELPQTLRTRVLPLAWVKEQTGGLDPFANANTPSELARLAARAG